MFDRQRHSIVVALEALSRHLTFEVCPRVPTVRVLLRRHTEPGVACKFIPSISLGITALGERPYRDVDSSIEQIRGETK